MRLNEKATMFLAFRSTPLGSRTW